MFRDDKVLVSVCATILGLGSLIFLREGAKEIIISITSGMFGMVTGVALAKKTTLLGVGKNERMALQSSFRGWLRGKGVSEP